MKDFKRVYSMSQTLFNMFQRMKSILRMFLASFENMNVFLGKTNYVSPFEHVSKFVLSSNMI
jgi:hypothetical protein